MNPWVVAIVDIWYVARAIEGEGCLQMAEPELCATWLAHSVVNRTARPWWPSSAAEVVKGAYHGYVRVEEPSERALGLAVDALARAERVNPGVYFMVSERDIRANGWEDRRDLIVRSFWDARHEQALHFLSEWIGE